MTASAKHKPAQQLDEMELWKVVIDSWKRLQRAAERNLLSAGLSLAEFRVLRMLRDQGSSPMVKLSGETLLSQPTITGLVDKLEELGFVERVRNLEDRREVLIALTTKGTGALSKAEQVHRQFVQRSLSVIPESEMSVLGRLLKRLADASEEASSGQHR